MNYWLICLPREDMEHCINSGTFGLARKNMICRVRQGDKIICCAGKGDWKFIAVGEATTDYYVDDKKIFLKTGSFIDRFDFKAKFIPQDVDMMQLLEQFSFVTNLSYWAVHFRNGITRLTSADWRLFGSVVSLPD